MRSCARAPAACVRSGQGRQSSLGQAHSGRLPLRVTGRPVLWMDQVLGQSRASQTLALPQRRDSLASLGEFLEYVPNEMKTEARPVSEQQVFVVSRQAPFPSGAYGLSFACVGRLCLPRHTSHLLPWLLVL